MPPTVEQLQDQVRELRGRLGKLERRKNPLDRLSVDVVDLGQTPSARMRATVAQTLSNATWETIGMDVIDWDHLGNGVDLVAETITVRRSGLYLVDGLCSFDGNTTGIRYTGFAVSGAASPTRLVGGWNGSSATLNVALRFTEVYELDVGDTVELQAWQNRGGTLSTIVSEDDKAPHLSVTLIGNN